MTAGKTDAAGKTGADNTDNSRTMTVVLAVSAADGSAAAAAAAAAESAGAAFDSNAFTKFGLKNPNMLESSTRRGGMMVASPPASEDVDSTSGIATEGAELGCKKFCRGFPSPTLGAKLEAREDSP